MRRRRGGDRGAATVFAAFGLLALLAVAAACIQLGGALVARHRAQSAADLGALAGASALYRGGDACGAVREYVRRNGAEPAGCAVSGATVLVHTSVALPLAGLPGPSAARAVARAGWAMEAQ